MGTQSAVMADGTVEISGRVVLAMPENAPVAGIALSVKDAGQATTGEDGRFGGLKVSVAKDGWIELAVNKPGYEAINALELRRPWPSPQGRSFHIVLAPEDEVGDRAAHYWSGRLLEGLKRAQPRGGDREKTAETPAELPGSEMLRAYGEWLAAIPEEEPSREWFQALALCLTGKTNEALKVLTPAPEPKERLRRQHLRAIAAMIVGDLKTARKELEAAMTVVPPDAWAQLQLSRVLIDAGESKDAWSILEALSKRTDIPLTMRVRATLGMVVLQTDKDDVTSMVRLFHQADEQFRQAASDGLLTYADEKRWTSLEWNLVVTALQVEKDQAKAGQLLEGFMKRHRALLARLPDIHGEAFVEALDLAVNVRIALNDPDQAKALLRERIAFHQEQSKAKPAEHLHQQARALEQLGDLTDPQKETAAAAEHYSAAIKIVMGLSQPREAEGHLPLMCRLLRKQGSLFTHSGQSDAAKTALHQAVALHQELNRVRPDHPPHQMERARSLQGLGNASMSLGESFAAAQAYLAAGQLYDRLVAQGDEEPRVRAFVCLKNVSAITKQAGQMKEAMAHALAALNHAEQIEANHPENHDDLAEISLMAAMWLIKDGNQPDAQPHMERAIRVYRKLAADDPAQFAVNLGLCLVAEGDLKDKSEQGERLDEAASLLQQHPDHPQAPLLREGLRLARKERGEVTL